MDIYDRLMLLAEFPKLAQVRFEVTSAQTSEYNCIAWAASETHRAWWPDKMKIGYWPKGIPREVTLKAFIQAYETLGYRPCEMNTSLELGKEKIAIFVGYAGRPTHAARQLENGDWTSKLGRNFDISHELLGVTGGEYGDVAQIMDRPRAQN